MYTTKLGASTQHFKVEVYAEVVSGKNAEVKVYAGVKIMGGRTSFNTVPEVFHGKLTKHFHFATTK